MHILMITTDIFQWTLSYFYIKTTQIIEFKLRTNGFITVFIVHEVYLFMYPFLESNLRVYTVMYNSVHELIISLKSNESSV